MGQTADPIRIVVHDMMDWRGKKAPCVGARRERLVLHDRRFCTIAEIRERAKNERDFALYLKGANLREETWRDGSTCTVTDRKNWKEWVVTVPDVDGLAKLLGETGGYLTSTRDYEGIDFLLVLNGMD